MKQNISRKKMLLGIWLTFSLLMSLTSLTMCFIVMEEPFYRYHYALLAVSQIIAITIFLVTNEKIKHVIVRILFKLCCFISVIVIPALIFIFLGLFSQYHAEIKDATYVSPTSYSKMLPSNKTVTYKTNDFYVFFPEYNNICFVSGNRPSKSDDSITWCSGAAFQHSVDIIFSDEIIEGHHATDGKYFESKYLHEGMGAVVFYDDKLKFDFNNPEAAIKDAAAHGGSGFMQFPLIINSQTIDYVNITKARCFRALAEINGNICIIDSIDLMRIDDFRTKLKELGVTNAVYLDMGAGWNYSWYRQAAGNIVTLFGWKVPWSHNWIVFKK